MLQPFVPFQDKFIPKLIELGRIYLVSQSYKRHFDHFTEKHKQGLVLTDYEDLGAAKAHLNAVKHDQYAAILYLDKPEHLDKLKGLIGTSSNFEVFWGIYQSKQSLKKTIDTSYKKQITRYIKNNTSWRIGGDTTIYPDVEIAFGELFIVLKYNNQIVRTRFEEIEKS